MSSICTWWLDDEHFSCCCIEPQSRINTCKEIDSNSTTREPTLIKICSKLLDANLSQGRTSPLDSLHLCWTRNILEGGYSRTVHNLCHNLGWLKFSMLPAQNFTQEYIIAAGCFSVFSVVVLCFRSAQDWKSLMKRCNPWVSTRPATSCDHWFFWL